jgi:TMEM175 potassium channel family protein
MAIAITLLVLDLKVPTESDVAAHEGSLILALASRWPSYLAYLAAFLTIGIIWLNHRAFVDKVRRFDNRMQWLNLMLLLGVATLPFPTSLLAAYVAEGGAPASTAAVVYGLLSVATALPWLFMLRHLVNHQELFEPPYGLTYARGELRRATIGPIVYVVAVPIALVAPILALMFYIAIAMLYAITNQGATATDG